MRVQDVMTDKVQTIAPSAAADAAWDLMRGSRFHHLVVTQGTEIVGVFSDRDAGGRNGAAIRNGRTVADLMSDSVITVTPATPLRKAANLMRGRAIGCLVVTQRGRVVGIITVADLLELLGRGAERPVESAHRWTLRHRVPHRKQALATGVW